MAKLTIVSGGVFASHLTAAGQHALKSGAKVILQTRRSYFARLLQDWGIAFDDMDDEYERAEDFDELNALIASNLVRAAMDGDVAYAALGSVTGQSIQSALCKEARKEGVLLEFLPGLSAGEAAFSAVAGQTGFEAAPHMLFSTDLKEAEQSIDPTVPLVVQELDKPMLASDVKLALLDYYPAEQIVTVAIAQENCYMLKSIELYKLDALGAHMHDAYAHTTCVLLPALTFEQLSRMGFRELEYVMDKLRAPGGCPWDREQTHESLKICLLEEAYEVIEAIDEHDDDKLCEELGDLLLQAVFHACIAKEQARFSMRDVTTGICQKLIYRHPHIFAAAQVNSAQDVLRNWEQLKKKEKKQNTQTDVLRAVPKPLPALTRSVKIQAKAAQVGFDWDNALDAFKKVREETDELAEEMNRSTIDSEAMAEELGDLLFAVANVARHLKIQPEFALLKSAEKFIDRFERMEKVAIEGGKKLEGMTLSEMDKIWNNIKHL